MASIPVSMAESSLFGHKRGSFTTALSDKKGLIEEANNGLCFLDEIGECPLEIQAKLLRAIQEGEVTPLGETKPRTVDVRFIAATNRDLNEAVRKGTFRLDLFHRLNTFSVRLLPLRERQEDIVFYANLFLKHLSPNLAYFFSAAAYDVLKDHSWPGNVRELKSVVERCIVMSSSRTIQCDDVKKAIDPARSSDSQLTPEPISHSKENILSVLKQANGNRARAARVLGVHPATLFRWLSMPDFTEAPIARQGRPKKFHSWPEEGA